MGGDEGDLGAAPAAEISDDQSGDPVPAGRFFTSGEYRQGEVHPSYAPSMDIQAASNFERFLYFLLGEDSVKVREVMEQMRSGEAMSVPAGHSAMKASRMTDAEIRESIGRVYATYGYVVDPHTACGFTDMAPDRVSVVLATAHPAKFPEVVQSAIGMEPMHPTLEALKKLPLETHPLEATPEAVKAFIATQQRA